MSNTYIELPIETDPQDIMDDFVTFMQTIVPGWEPAPGNLDTWIAQAMSLAAAESRDVASAVSRSIFRYFGATLAGLPPIDDVAASVLSTWTVVDNQGYTIPIGTQVSISATGDQVYAFETANAVVIPPGSISASDVQLVAVTPGLASSNLGVAGGTVTLIDPLAFVSSITQQATTSGGQDAESDDDYLTRLAQQLTLSAPRPILPGDFAAFAKNIGGVYRATAIDGYDPATNSTGNARTVAVAAVDINGVPVSSAVKGAIQADLQARREVNFIVNVIDPVISQIDVNYQVQGLSGYDKAALLVSINAAINTYLDASSWGAKLGPRDWTNTSTVRYLELAQVINDVPGVDYITGTPPNMDLSIALHGGGLARNDITLSGQAPLADVGTLTGTVL